MEEITIYCSVPEEEDETGANGLWDLAGELAVIAGLAAKASKPDGDAVYAEDFGQDEIYYKLRSLVKEEE